MVKIVSKSRYLVLCATVLFTILALAACSSQSSQYTATVDETLAVSPSITVNDQSVADGKVTIADVFSKGAGWVAIQVDNNGKPGDILGETAVKDGDNQNVVVTIDPLKSTPVMYASLYIDAGTTGKFEPTGADTQQKVGGQPIQPIFNVTGGLPSPTVTSTSGPTPTEAAIIQTYQSSTLGIILTNENGMTLYYWKHDAYGSSNCIGTCLNTWTPLLTNGQPKAGDPATIVGTFGIFTRLDGSQQVTYDGHPLYIYSGDKVRGDTKGQGVDGTWYTFPAGGLPTATPTVTLTPAVTDTPTP